MKLFRILILTVLTGCTTLSAIDISQSKLAVATHNDLQAAAKYATDHGYPARAAVWLAEDARLAAIEVQINACAKAIEAALPPAPTGQIPTPFLGLEMAAEAVGTFSGISPSIKINCAAFPIVALPLLPKLP